MELMSLLCTVTVAGLVLFILFYLKIVRRRSYYNQHLPGWKLRPFDVLGDLGVIAKAGYKDLTETAKLFQILGAYVTLFRESKLCTMWFSYNPNIIVTTAEATEEVMSGTSYNNKSWWYNLILPWLGEGLLISNGIKWKSRRKLLTPAFHFDILKDFLPVINEKSQILVEILRKEIDKQWTHISKLLALCSLDIICETTLGVHVGAQENNNSAYVQAVERSTNIIVERALHPKRWYNFIFYLTERGRQFKNDLKLLHSFTRNIIKERKQELLTNTHIDRDRKRKPLMDLLLEHHIRDNSITEEDIREEVDTFAFEGHDTTAAGMKWSLYLIGLYEDVQKKIHEELDYVFGSDRERPVAAEDLKHLKYLECVLKESQRLYPSVPYFARHVNEDTKICGYNVPKDCSIFIVPFFLHRDEKVFPDPEKFDPDRFLPENSANRNPYAYIPFSAGPRNCIGQRFALMEEKVVVANILRNFKIKSLQQRDEIILVPHLILKSEDPLKVKFYSK